MPRPLIVLAFMLSVLHAHAQLDETAVTKLKQQSGSLDDTSRIKQYIRIARHYIVALPVSPDSVIKYARWGYALSLRIDHKVGQAASAATLADGLLQAGIPNEAYDFFSIALRIAKEYKDERMEMRAIRGLGQALWYEGNYDRAVDTLLLAIEHFKKMNWSPMIPDAMVTISSIYGDQGNYEKAFESAQQALVLSKEYNDGANTVLSLAQIGKLYRNIGDYATAISYYKMGYAINPPKGQWAYRHLAHCMGDVCFDRKLYDSALYYYKESFEGNPDSRFSILRMGQYYLQREKYDSAYTYLNFLYVNINKSGEGHILYDAMLGLGHIYLEKRNFTKALRLANEVLEMAQIKKGRLAIQDASHLLSDIYSAANQPAKALLYFKQYVDLKDSIVSDQLKGRLYEFRRIIDDGKKTTQIELLKREKQLSDQKLRNNQFLRNVLLSGILILALLSAIIVWIISLKRKNEKLRNESSRIEWERLATDLEMQALRAQMNPHFIFNCLSSINKFILKNEPDQASDYLTKFSRLIRLVLISSQKIVISLEDEIEMLKLYIDMEQLRFRNQFSYSIVYATDINPGSIMIPPLLLQPFCENAIWHGLMHKEEPGHLCITFDMKDGVLQCTIADNGIGRLKASEIKKSNGEERKSLGLKLTSERLALFNEDNGIGTSWFIEDIKDPNGEVAGTRVVLVIRQKKKLEEMA